MGRARNLLVVSWMAAMVVMCASPLWAQRSDLTTFTEGEQVELTGTVAGDWFTVTEGPYAQQQFELVRNRELEMLQREGSAGAVYRLSGQALTYQGSNLIFIISFTKTPYVSSSQGPPVKGGGSRSSPSPRRYREGS